MKVIKPAAIAKALDHVNGIYSPVIAQNSQLARQTIVIGTDDTPIPCRPKHLRWIEAKDPGISKRATFSPLERCAQSLSRILDHDQAMLASESHDRIHVGSLSV